MAATSSRSKTKAATDTRLALLRSATTALSKCSGTTSQNLCSGCWTLLEKPSSGAGFWNGAFSTSTTTFTPSAAPSPHQVKLSIADPRWSSIEFTLPASCAQLPRSLLQEGDNCTVVSPEH